MNQVEEFETIEWRLDVSKAFEIKNVNKTELNKDTRKNAEFFMIPFKKILCVIKSLWIIFYYKQFFQFLCLS